MLKCKKHTQETHLLLFLHFGGRQGVGDTLNPYSRGLDAELVYMVTKCSHLVHLEYNGRLRVNTIRGLAGLRGSRWRHFLVDLDNTVTQDVDSDDDVTVKQLAAEVALITRK